MSRCYVDVLFGFLLPDAVSDEKSRARMEDIARGLDRKIESLSASVARSCLSNARSRSPWPCK